MSTGRKRGRPKGQGLQPDKPGRRATGRPLANGDAPGQTADSMINKCMDQIHSRMERFREDSEAKGDYWARDEFGEFVHELVRTTIDALTARYSTAKPATDLKKALVGLVESVGRTTPEFSALATVIDIAMPDMFPKMDFVSKAVAVSKQRELTASKRDSPIVLTLSQLRDVVSRLESKTTLDSVSFEYSFVFLQLTSGCRKIELLDCRVSSFEISDDNFVLQKGVSKRRPGATAPMEQPGDGHHKFIPFTTPTEWMAILKSFRIQVGEIGHLNRAQLGAMYARRLEIATQRIFYWLEGVTFQDPDGVTRTHTIGTHFNRCVYARACAILQPRLPGSTATEARIVQNALCHMFYGTQAFYERVVLLDDALPYNGDLVAAAIARQANFEEDRWVKVGGLLFQKARKTRRTAKMKRQHVAECEALLLLNNIKPTFSNLRKLGIGSTSISHFHDKTLCL